MTNECRWCDHVHTATRHLSPWKWRCLKAPVLLQGPPELKHVDPSYRTDPPYETCWRQNKDGDCVDFTKKREATGAKL